MRKTVVSERLDIVKLEIDMLLHWLEIMKKMT